ncbi:hypothetical protein GUJ93_ZPchr0013g36019 [Zizania palustris]|uniref:CW-type domain-containing protein n=1 Tax=Zizania palustris TaxID=103762 RepID=A0A8J5X3T3_ZIZPA|nr:hypothetical protein GUJ93_ZPchr0013g36019 [Zizania palustris]
MYVLEGVTPCIQSMQLQAGDTVTFSRIDPEGKLVMGFRKATNLSTEQEQPIKPVNGVPPPPEANIKVSAPDSSPNAALPRPNKVNAESKSSSPVEQATPCKMDKSALAQKEGPGTASSSPGLVKRKATSVGPKIKRFRMDSEESMELKITWEEAQELLRPPLKAPSIVVVDGHEFEEYEEPPILGRRTYFVTDQSGENHQWAQCEDCSKWRKLPVDALLPSKWTCSDNKWDPERFSCVSAQEINMEELAEMIPLKPGAAKKSKGKVDTDSIDVSDGLDTLANLAILGESESLPSQPTTRHPRHRPGCSCIVCIQPPSGKGPKHKQTCTCNVCMTVRRRFRTLMMRREKRQSVKDETSHRNEPGQSSEPVPQTGSSTVPTSTTSSPKKANTNGDGPDDMAVDNKRTSSPIKNQIDLNSQPEREDDQSPKIRCDETPKGQPNLGKLSGISWIDPSPSSKTFPSATRLLVYYLVVGGSGSSLHHFRPSPGTVPGPSDPLLPPSGGSGSSLHHFLPPHGTVPGPSDPLLPPSGSSGSSLHHFLPPPGTVPGPSDPLLPPSGGSGSSLHHFLPPPSTVPGPSDPLLPPSGGSGSSLHHFLPPPGTVPGPSDPLLPPSGSSGSSLHHFLPPPRTAPGPSDPLLPPSDMDGLHRVHYKIHPHLVAPIPRDLPCPPADPSGLDTISSLDVSSVVMKRTIPSSPISIHHKVGPTPAPSQRNPPGPPHSDVISTGKRFPPCTSQNPLNKYASTPALGPSHSDVIGSVVGGSGSSLHHFLPPPGTVPGPSDPLLPPSGGSGSFLHHFLPPHGTVPGPSDPLLPPSGGSGSSLHHFLPPPDTVPGPSDPLIPPSGGSGSSLHHFLPPPGTVPGPSDPLLPPSGGSGSSLHHFLPPPGTAPGPSDPLLPPSDMDGLHRVHYKTHPHLVAPGPSDLPCPHIGLSGLDTVSPLDVSSVVMKRTVPTGPNPIHHKVAPTPAPSRRNPPGPPHSDVIGSGRRFPPGLV